MAIHPETLREGLRRVPFLSKFDDAALDTVGSVLKPRRFEVDAVAYRQGDNGDSLLLVLEGRLAVRVKDKTGVDVEIGRIYSGDLTGEIACVDPGPRTATVVATLPTRALELDRMLLSSLVKHAPEMATAFLAAVLTMTSRRIREVLKLVEHHQPRHTPARSADPLADGALGRPVFDANGRIDLHSVPCLRSFSREELATLISVAPARRVTPGTELCREGERAESCFIVAAGICEVSRVIGGNRTTTAILPHGSLVEPLALIEDAPYLATVHLRTDGIVLEFRRRAYRTLLGSADAFAVKLQDQLAIAAVRQCRLAIRQLSHVVRPEAPRTEARTPWQPEGSTVDTRVRAHTEPVRRASLDSPTIPPTRMEDLPPHIRKHVRDAATRAMNEPSIAPGTLREPPPPRIPTPATPAAAIPTNRAARGTPNPSLVANTPPAVAIGSTSKNEDDQLADVFAYLTSSFGDWNVSFDEVQIVPTEVSRQPPKPRV